MYYIQRAIQYFSLWLTFRLSPEPTLTLWKSWFGDRIQYIFSIIQSDLYIYNMSV